jgi:Mrp family chromosome partitioning ATPase
MDLHEYLRLLRRRWRLLAACVLVAAFAAFLTTPEAPRNDTVTYSATHQILRDSSALAPQALATVALFIKTGEVPARVAERIDYNANPALLAAGVVVEANEAVGSLDITTTGNSRSEAVDRANIFAEETLALLGEQAAAVQQEQIERVNDDLATLQADIDALDSEIASVEAAGRSTALLEAERDSKLRRYGAAIDQQQQVLDQPAPTAGYITLQPALPELTSVEGGGFSAPRSREARTAIAAGIGLLLGLAALLLIERLDTRLHEVHDIADAFALPVVAEVPLVASRKREHVMADRDPMSALAESYRTLRSSLLLSPITPLGLAIDRRPRAGEPEVILVTSAAPGDGKTTTVANLAVTMAESGRTVLVLGCDFRRPEIHGYFDRPSSPGIADVLRQDNGTKLADVVVGTDVPGVFLAPSGERLRSFGDVAAAGRELVAEARQLADVVIIDTPPALATNDASELIPATDAVVVVARIDKTTTDGARRTRFLLDRLSAPVAGVVVVGAAEAPGTYGSYGAYYTTPERGRRRKQGGNHVRSESDNGGHAPVAIEKAAPTPESESKG